MADGKGQVTFNLQLLTDQGIVLCPGFHRDQQVFTSTDLLATVRPPPASAAAPSHPPAGALPAFRANADVETAYSPTLLPSLPELRGEDSSHGAAQPASTPILDELIIAFDKGVFSLMEPPATAALAPSAAAADASSSFLTAASHSTTAAATAALKRLSLTAWRTPNPAPSVPASSGNDSDNASFPPSSPLPPAASADDESSAESEQEVDRAAAEQRSPSADDHAVSPAASAAKAATRGEVVEQAADSHVKLRSTAVPFHINPTATSDSAAAVTTSALTSLSASPTSSSFSPLSLPAALFSNVSSWLFPRTALQQPADSTFAPAASSTAPSPTPPPPPPPPPPYAMTLRRVVVIGVHGWSLFGGMLGDRPLNVSSRFCYYIHHALQRYMRALPGDDARPPLHVTCIPLYGHGRVEERVAMYVEAQLPQYADELRRADHVIIACHSQGCMVTSSLLALLLFGANPPLALPAPPHISILMLAGLHHGPFPDLPTDLYPPTKELLAYAHFHSQHAQLHAEHMRRLLDAGVRVLLVGSVHDAVVPLYSSLGQMLGRSPNLLRALYADYAHYQPDFLYAFLSLALYQQNRPLTTAAGGGGGADVLTHLSGFLRGSLLEKAGGAHSAMHRLVDVYGLAVEWALSGRGEVLAGTATAAGTAAQYSGVMWSAQLTDGFTTSKLNRHLLVWSVRGMLAELDARRGEQGLNVDEERRRLLELFAEWAPKSKNLRSLRETLAVLFDGNSRNNGNGTIHSNL